MNLTIELLIGARLALVMQAAEVAAAALAAAKVVNASWAFGLQCWSGGALVVSSGFRCSPA